MVVTVPNNLAYTSLLVECMVCGVGRGEGDEDKMQAIRTWRSLSDKAVFQTSPISKKLVSVSNPPPSCCRVTRVRSAFVLVPPVPHQHVVRHHRRALLSPVLLLDA